MPETRMPETRSDDHLLPALPIKALSSRREKDAFASTVSTYLRAVHQRLVTEHEKDVTLLQQENQSLREELLRFRGQEPGARTATTCDIDQAQLAFVPREEFLQCQDQGATQETKRGDVDSNGGSTSCVDGATYNGKKGRFDNSSDGKEDPSNVANGSAQATSKPDAGQETAAHLKQISKEMAMRDRTNGLYEDGRPVPMNDRLKTQHTLDVETGMQENRLQRLVFSNRFELASGAIILANTVVMALQLQYHGFEKDYILNGCNLPEPPDPKKPHDCTRKNAEDTWPGADTAFEIFNVTFNFLFLVELLLRIGANRWKSIKNGWIWFDAIVVSVGIVDVLVKDALAFNPGMMRAVRLVRLVRLLKVFQAMSSFDSLFLLLKALFASREALVWSFLILGMVQLIVGLFLCQILQDFLGDDSVDMDSRRKVYEFFGTFSRTMLTMFEITMANWIVSCRALTDNVTEWFMVFYIAYRCMFCFAILKVIAAVFITETNRVLESDDELTVMKHNRAEMGFRNRLVALFKAIDPDGTGTLGWNQLDELMTDEALSASVTVLGFSVHDFEKLFWLLDDGSGKIEIHEFVNKMEKLKGQSKEIDTLTMLKLAHHLDIKISYLLDAQGLLEKRNELEMAEEELACRV